MKPKKQRAINGVHNYLTQYGYRDINKINEVVYFYCAEKRFELPLKDPLIAACLRIQKDFPSFANWLKEQKLIPYQPTKKTTT